MSMSAFLLFAAAGCLIASVSNAQTANCTLPPWRDAFIFSDPSYALRYYSNVDLSASTSISKPSKAVIVIHGTARNADDYYCAMFGAAQIQGYEVTNQDIIIIAPRFMEHQDNPNSNEYYWTGAEDTGWKAGGNSVVPKDDVNNQLPAYGAIDALIEYLVTQKSVYPNLVNVTVAGHSAGGQFTQRYALTTPLTLPQGYSVSYVAANPSTFCYLDSRRWFNNQVFRELTAAEQAACPSYNAWKYGFTSNAEWKFPPYIVNQNLSLSQVQQRYKLKNMTYLQGTNDVCNNQVNTTCDDHDMDTSCEADIQGTFRLERGMNFLRSLTQIYGEPVHRISMVPFVGHDDVDMFQHPNGRRAIF